MPASYDWEHCPKAHAGEPQSLANAAIHALLRQLVGDHPELTLYGLCTRVAAETGVRLSVRDNVSRPLARGLATQKKSLHASERDAPRIQQA